MLWSIVEVVRMSGVTSRTLRHYGQVGLLPPAAVDDAGRRFYGQDELVRLQQIIMLRQLGLGLEAITTILAGERDQLQALRQHRRWLLAESERFARLADSVSVTIADLQGGSNVSTKERLAQWFENTPRGSEEYQQREQEAAERWGQVAIDTQQRTRSWSQETYDAVNQQGIEAHARIAELAAAGVPAEDERTLDAVANHHAWLRQHWEPSSHAYRKLGQMYADPNDRFRGGFEAAQTGLANYLRDAMAAYATHRM